MKIIHTGDWHLGKILNDYSLLDDQRFWLDAFIEKMKEVKPDAVIIAGDIYDRAIPPAEAVTLLSTSMYRLTHEVGCQVIIIAGNHDSKERLSFGSELLSQNGLHIIGNTATDIAKITLTDERGPVNFYALPYCDLHTIKSLLDLKGQITLSEATALLCRPMLDSLPETERNILIAHGFFAASRKLTANDGTEVGGSEIVDLRPFEAFDYIALGHIHGPKGAGFPHAKYAGSPLKYSIDEAYQKKSCYLVDLQEKGSFTANPVIIPPKRELRILEGDFSEIMEGSEPSDDYIFVRLTDKIPVTDAVSKLKAIFPNILGIRFTELTSMLSGNRPDSKEIREKNIDELFHDFYQASTGNGLTDFQCETVREILEQLRSSYFPKGIHQ